MDGSFLKEIQKAQPHTQYISKEMLAELKATIGEKQRQPNKVASL